MPKLSRPSNAKDNDCADLIDGLVEVSPSIIQDALRGDVAGDHTSVQHFGRLIDYVTDSFRWVSTLISGEPLSGEMIFCNFTDFS